MSFLLCPRTPPSQEAVRLAEPLVGSYHKPLILICLIVLLLACSCAKTEHADARQPKETPSPGIKKPNILIIVVDTLRFDSTSLAKQHGGNTPFLQRLARQGVNFRMSFSTFDFTPSSHFSLLTGYISAWQTSIDSASVSLAYQLRKQGYDTFGIAANGMLTRKAMPVLDGFEKYVSLEDTWLHMPARQKRRFYQDIDSRIRMYGGRHNDFNRMTLFSSAKRILPIAKDYLKSARHPFLGFLNFMEPHDPYFPDQEFYSPERTERKKRPAWVDPDLRFRAVNSDLVHPENIKDDKLRVAVLDRLRATGYRGWSLSYDLSKEQLAMYRMRYDAEVKEIDSYLEELFRFMEREKLVDSTIFIITSDHGESFGEQGFVGHSLSEQGDREATHHVPLLFCMPNAYQVQPGELNVLCSSADIAPTVYDLVGIDWAPLAIKSSVGNYGKSLLPYINLAGRAISSSRVSVEGIEDQPISEQDRFKKEGIERLRSLGHVK